MRRSGSAIKLARGQQPEELQLHTGLPGPRLYAPGIWVTLESVIGRNESVGSPRDLNIDVG